MSATGYTPIITYNSGTTTNVPLAANLASGELAINYADGKLFYKDSGGTVQVIATKAGATGTVSSVAATVPSFLSISGSPITTSGTLAITLSGTALPTTSGGTGLTSFTANGVVYASSTSALATGSALTFDGTTLVSGTGIRAGSYMEIRSNSASMYWENAANNIYWSQALASSNFAWSYYNGTSVSEIMRLTTSGYLGIGTSSPTASLTVNGNISIPERTSAVIGVDYATTSGNGGNLTVRAGDGNGSGNTSGNLYLAFGRGGASASNGYMAFGVAQSDNSSGLNSEYMRLDGSGNLGLGVTPSSWGSRTVLELAGGTYFGTASGTNLLLGQNNYFNGTNYIYKTTGATTLYDQAAGTHYWFNAPSGSAGGTISFTQAMTLSNAGGLSVGTTTDPGAGAIYATGNITAYYSSDIKFKTNVQDIQDPLGIVTAIGSKTFDWTDEYLADHGGEDEYFQPKQSFGVIAQDVQKVFPQAVRTRTDGSLAVDYEKLAILSFGAIGQLLKRVEALESK